MPPPWDRCSGGFLNDLGEAHPSVGEVRSIGLFGIIELVRDPSHEGADGTLELIQPGDEGPQGSIACSTASLSTFTGTRS